MDKRQEIQAEIDKIISKDRLYKEDVAWLANCYTALQALSGDKLSTKELKSAYETEFTEAIKGKNTTDVMNTLAEFFDTLKIVDPRTYNGILSRFINL